MKSESKSIDISVELYETLRGFCDKNGLRFVDFIEDSLETATYRDELEQLFSDKAELDQRVETERVKAIQHGFSHGVLAATLALTGAVSLAASLTPEAVEDTTFFEPVQGVQLKLFD